MGRKGWLTLFITLAAVLAVAGASQAFFLTRFPYFRKYAAQNGVDLREARKAWGRPDSKTERIMGMAVEASLGNWQKVSSLASVDLKSEIGTYYYNLANAHQDQLPDRLMDYYQPFERGFVPACGREFHTLPDRLCWRCLVRSWRNDYGRTRCDAGHAVLS